LPKQKKNIRTESDAVWDRKIGAALAFIRRRDCNQSQEVFAKRFGISRSLLANVESGRNPLLAHLGWNLCRSLDIHPSWLCGAGNSAHQNVFPIIGAENLTQIESVLFANRYGLFREVWPALARLAMQDDEGTPEKDLTQGSLKSNNTDVKSEIEKLIERLKRKASKPGAKAELARTLNVAPARISEWLSGEKEPGGEYTLRLLKWVEQ